MKEDNIQNLIIDGQDVLLVTEKEGLTTIGTIKDDYMPQLNNMSGYKVFGELTGGGFFLKDLSGHMIKPFRHMSELSDYDKKHIDEGYFKIKERLIGMNLTIREQLISQPT